MKDEPDILMMNNILRNLGYTGIGDRDSKIRTFFTITLPKLVEEIQNKTFDENTSDSFDLQGIGVKILIPSNIIDIYTRLGTLLSLKLSGHSDTLLEASNLINDIYKIAEIENNNNIEMPLIIFKPNKWNYLVNY